jgi:hypothetical protein
MTRVWLNNPPWDYVQHYRPIRWDSVWIERPRLWASAVALALAAPQTVCDPACGDATVVMKAHELSPISHAVLGDISPDTLRMIPDLPFSNEKRPGDLFETLESLDHVDAIVLTEIVEHVEDPDALLRLARSKASWLVASSPIVRAGVRDHTDQHMWSFDQEGYRETLVAAGWTPKTWMTANCTDHPYADGFQVWGCE